MSSTGIMTNEKPQWGDASTPARMCRGVRVLWSVIAGYAIVAFTASWMLDARGTHVLGVVGAIIGVLVTLRQDRDGGPPRPTKDRPHDGWIV